MSAVPTAALSVITVSTHDAPLCPPRVLRTLIGASKLITGKRVPADTVGRPPQP